MERLGANRNRISVALGPTIRQQNYEVGAEFVERFVTVDRANIRFFAASQRDGHAMFDLPSYIAERIRQAGIAQFEDLGLCTYADPSRFFSYRRTTLARRARLWPARQCDRACRVMFATGLFPRACR